MVSTVWPSIQFEMELPYAFISSQHQGESETSLNSNLAFDVSKFLTGPPASCLQRTIFVATISPSKQRLTPPYFKMENACQILGNTNVISQTQCHLLYPGGQRFHLATWVFFLSELHLRQSGKIILFLGKIFIFGYLML